VNQKRLSRLEVNVKRLWETMTKEELAKTLGLSLAELFLTAQRLGVAGNWRIKSDDPSEEQIAAMAAEIRSGWSEEEEKSRRVGRLGSGRRWTPPEVQLAESEAPTFSASKNWGWIA